MKIQFANIIHNRQFKKTVAIFTSVFVLALVLNWAVLNFFGQKSEYRAEHSLVGILLLIGFFYLLKDYKISGFKLTLLFFLSLIPCYIGTVFSDLDIKLLGIGGHRNPLFHSGLLYFFIIFLIRRNKSILLHTLVGGFGVGLASHLLWDVFDHADVRWLPGAVIDRLWLGVNGILCLVLVSVFLTSLLKKSN